MKRNKRIVIRCSIVSAICFGFVSYGHFYRGRIELGWTFAILTAVQLVLAVMNYIISKKKMIGIGAGIMEKNLKRIGLTLLSAVSALFLYIFLHESGHLIVMLSAGATVTSFRILTAHVSAMGGEYTTLSSLWLHANGAILPMVAAFVYMLVYRKDCRKSFYRIFSFFVSLIPTASMLAWVILPFLFLQGNAPAKDDVTHFLNIFSDLFHPLIVSAVSAAIIVISITLIYKKGILQNYIKEVRQLKQQ